MRRRQQDGFVLAMTLLVIALAGVVMASAARRSCLEAVQANTAMEELRRRWGSTSLQAALANRCEALLAAAEAEENAEGPVRRVEHELTLAGMQFRLVVTDEQAKVNVNTLHARGGPGRLRAALAELLGEDMPDVEVALRPDRPSANAARPFRAYRSLGQVFAGDWSGRVLRARPDEPARIERITCWGDGRTNFRRATPEALRAAGEGVLNETQREMLLELRRDIPGLSLAEATKRLELTRKQREEVSKILTDRSRCHALWIIARTDQRSWRRLVIVEQRGGWAKEAGPPLSTFLW